MNVLIVTDTYTPEINGVARTLETLARGMARRGHSVTVLTTMPELTFWRDEDPLVRVQRVRSIPVPGYSSLRMGLIGKKRVGMMMDAWKIDAVYVAVETPMGLAAIRAANKRNLPVVSGFHTNFHHYMENYKLPFLRKIAAAYLRWIHNLTQRTLTPSKDTAAELRAVGIHGVGLMGRGVDTKLFHPARRDEHLRASWGAVDDAPVLLFVSRLALEKNLQLTANVMRRLLERNPRARGVFVGDGPKAPWLRSLNMPFVIAGARRGEDLARHYASADVFLFPSVTETYGNVLPEAMASGLATVSYRYAAAGELITDGQNGFTARFGDEAAFQRAADTAYNRWDDQGLRGAARAGVSHLSWEAIVAQFERELREAGRMLKPQSAPGTAPLITTA